MPTLRTQDPAVLKKQHAENQYRRYKRLRESGCCIDCSIPLIDDERVRCEYHRNKRNAENLARYHRDKSKWRKTSIQAWAQDKVNKALKRGFIKRRPCTVCGSTVRPEAHHEDYSHPLAVTWLCGTHHRLRHRPSKAAAR